MSAPNKHPQEIEVWYVLPAVRKELVVALKVKGFSQKKIAEYLNITEPAVSQYIKLKRAKDVNLPDKVKKFVKEAAEKIVDKKTAFQQIQEICKHIKETKAICAIHKCMEKGLEKCDVCYSR